MSFDLHALKCLLPEYLRAHGCELFFRGDDHFKTACPIHGGVKRNFHADRLPDGEWVWNCRSGCGGDGGSVIDLHARLNGLDAKTARCIAGAAEILRIKPDESPRLSGIPADQKAKRLREEKERAAKVTEATAITNHLRQTLEKRLSNYPNQNWRGDLGAGSLVLMKGREEDARLMISSLFMPDDFIWLGETWESGQEENRENFRPCSEWLKADYLSPRIAAGIFKPGSISRSAENVEKSPFIVIESDELIGHEPKNPDEREANKALSFSLFFYCHEILGLHPRAVIDTGNKSLHLWFDRPEPDEFSALLALADGLRIDKGLLARCPFSPLRLPGTIHEKTGQPATLLFINPIHPHHQ